MEKYYNDKNELAILYSPGYGAGWSTWNQKELAYDKRIIEKWLAGATEDEMHEFLEELGYYDVYMGGYNNLEITYIPRGTWFCICEYDGLESIGTADTILLMEA